MTYANGKTDKAGVSQVEPASPAPAAASPTAGSNTRISRRSHGAAYIDPVGELLRRATQRYGVIRRSDARAIGISDGMLARLVRRGVLRREAPGIYVAAGAPDSRERRWYVAQERSGEGSVLSHRTAGIIHELTPHDVSHGIDLIVPSSPRLGSADRRLRVVHGGLPRSEVTRRRHLRVTTVARTLCDLAGDGFSPEEVRELVASAVRARAVTPVAIRATVHRRGRLPGRAALRRAVDEIDPLEPFSRSALESRFLRVTRPAGVAPTRMNVPVIDAQGHRRVLDAVWEPEGLVAELDSRRYHGTLIDWHDDLRRENDLALVGYPIALRFSWIDLVDHAPRVISTVRHALARLRDGRG